jgi:hypothetical protein
VEQTTSSLLVEVVAAGIQETAEQVADQLGKTVTVELVPALRAEVEPKH